MAVDTLNYFTVVENTPASHYFTQLAVFIRRDNLHPKSNLQRSIDAKAKAKATGLLPADSGFHLTEAGLGKKDHGRIQGTLSTAFTLLRTGGFIHTED